jgi:hypothetical protein
MMFHKAHHPAVIDRIKEAADVRIQQLLPV